jgi:MFS transporter, DHA2 family, multidrug resistance protein
VPPERAGEAVPAGVSPEASETARDTLGGAVDAVERLPDAVGTRLLDAAQEAFSQGMQIAAVTSAAVALGTAALVGVLPRRMGADIELEGESAACDDAAEVPRP